MKGGLSRWRRRFTLLPSSFILALAACRTPTYPVPEVSDAAVAAERVALQTRFLLADDERRERLHRVTFPILREAAKLFDRTPRPAMGIVLLSDRAYPESYRARARELWKISDEPIVRHVAPDSPAETAGLHPGDRLVGIGGERVGGGLGAFIDALEDHLEPDHTLALTVEQDGNVIELEVTPVPIADYRIRLRYDSSINALATGRSIEVNRAMIDFCKNDTELAFVVAHELAHNALRHQRDFVVNYLLGTAADVALLLAGVPTPNALGVLNTVVPSADFESEADVVAVVLLRNAGYDPAEALDFWPRLGALQPEAERGFLFFSTHPDFATRQARLRAAIEQLADE